MLCFMEELSFDYQRSFQFLLGGSVRLQIQTLSFSVLTGYLINNVMIFHLAAFFFRYVHEDMKYSVPPCRASKHLTTSIQSSGQRCNNRPKKKKKIKGTNYMYTSYILRLHQKVENKSQFYTNVVQVKYNGLKAKI